METVTIIARRSLRGFLYYQTPIESAEGTVEFIPAFLGKGVHELPSILEEERQDRNGAAYIKYTVPADRCALYKCADGISQKMVIR